MSQTGGNNGDDIDGGADGVVEEVVVGGIREDGGSRSDEEGDVEGRAVSEGADIGLVPGNVATEAVFSPARPPSRIYMLTYVFLRMMTLAWRWEPEIVQLWYLPSPLWLSIDPCRTLPMRLFQWHLTPDSMY